MNAMVNIPSLHHIRIEQDRRRGTSLAQFAKMAWPILEPSTELKWGWALDAICEHLEAVTNGDIRRLLMNVPPGSMKSLLTSVIWTAYEWGPRGLAGNRFLGTAHKQDLAVRDATKCRRLIQSQWYQDRWPIKLTSDQNAKTKFENDHTGFREAMAFTSMTGARADRVIIDDPHSVDDANSPVKLATDILTFREALPSRVNNEQSAIVVIMQRLNQADVAASALELGYEHLCIPMRFEHGRGGVTAIGWTDPRTVEGELMFPERFPEKQVRELEISLGSFATAGQLQQRPTPRAGGLFKLEWFADAFVGAAPSRVKRVRAWDLASTAKKAGNNPDWTVGIRVAREMATGLFFVEGALRVQQTAGVVAALIKATAVTDGATTRVRIPKDPGQAGVAQAETMILSLAGHDAVAVAPTGDKETRATPAAVQCEAHNVKIIRTGDPTRDAWIEPFLAELTMFPAGAHDDQVDAFADAMNELALGSRYSLDNV